MTKYYPEPDGKSFPQMEQEVLLQWEQGHLLSKVKGRMEGGRPLVFCEGPPTANAKPHIGHALTRAVKDAFLRYHVMNGRKIVPYIGGWDCHGLPVEIEVERALGIQSKKDIHKVGPYCPRCGTTLSTHEVALGFRETEGRSIIVKFRLKGLDLTLLAWTATPWALLGNALLAVDRETTYSVIEHSGERLAVAEDRVGFVSLEGNLVGRLRGSELVGKGYE